MRNKTSSINVKNASLKNLLQLTYMELINVANHKVKLLSSIYHC